MVMTFVFCEMQILFLTSRCCCLCKCQAVQVCCAGECHTVCVEITRIWGGEFTHHIFGHRSLKKKSLHRSRHCSLCVCARACLLHLWIQKYKFHVLGKCTSTKVLNTKYQYCPLHLHSVLNTFSVWFVASWKRLPRMAYYLRTLHCVLNMPLDS